MCPGKCALRVRGQKAEMCCLLAHLSNVNVSTNTNTSRASPRPSGSANVCVTLALSGDVTIPLFCDTLCHPYEYDVAYCNLQDLSWS